MKDQQPLPPEGFRTAAYLEARARIDAGKSVRKTNRRVQCTPPNVQCGGRCIPPTWDCRLKGQGADPHLRAVKTDPLGGLANVQRGFARISKGITKGNFSEVEGGKRAIIRGVVKTTPGDLQQKKELKRKLEERTRAIGMGLAVVTGGLGIHALLMKTDTFGYRNGAGANINNAVRTGISRILDATPVVGANRARVRAAAQAGVAQELTRQNNPVSGVLTGQMARTRITETDSDSRSNLVRALNSVNDQFGGANSDFNAWNRAHQRAFWTTTKLESGVGGTRDASIFARPATEDFLARQFNLRGDDTLTTGSIKDAIEQNIREYKTSLLDLAQQEGFRVKSTRTGSRYLEGQERRRFIQNVVSGALPAGQSTDRLRAELTKQVEGTLTRSPKGQADTIYRDTFVAFDEYYQRQGRITENAYSATRITAEMRRAGVDQTLLDGRQVRADYVLGLMRPGSTVRGPAHAELALREYHARTVAGTTRSMYTISNNLAMAAASELEGRPVPRSEAFRVLEREGFTGAVPPASARRAARPATEGEAVYQLMRQNPGMTLQAARRAVRERRSDVSPEIVRTAAYLAARADLQEGRRLGKPCGESHIPKSHECRKGTGVASAAAIDSTKVKLVAAVGAAALTGGLLASIGVNRSKVNAYRSNVSDSALKAETLAKTMMDEMRQSASSRLGKDVKNVTGFEASVYNFKDSGHDRGFGGNDKAPDYFGQTPNSRGAVVMLSYADDNRFTRQGQGSYKMARSGAFQEIWGEHDILPFANSISQPSRRSPDDITLNARDRVVKAAGPLGKGVKSAIETKEALSNFEYLQENINRRGHNPDAIRAAAFVAAQRRLTGKPVHIMSYSNGGNVASETLAILKEMGYRDVKVVNVAGPTFGVFKHSQDQMRTWVSRGDEFWAMGRSAAFQGSNVQFLRNSNIPHGLTAKTDPSNRENGANWKANYKAKNSYLLDEQLQQEAHRFLTVDKRRSRELADEFIWRTAERKPMEGDLDTLIGQRSSNLQAAYVQRRRRNVEEADEWLRTELEKSMIDKWYNGYSPKVVKKRQKDIQRELQEQIYGRKTDA